jgi:DNA polymerase
VLSLTEQAVWLLSRKINERGFCVDREFAEAARQIAQAAAPEIDTELGETTGGFVTGVNQVARQLRWLQQQGCTMQKLDRKAIERQLEKEDLPAAVRRVLELRLGGAQAAVKKIDALLARAGTDDRVRGAFRYHGASTGRWAGEGFQPQNLKRPVVEDPNAAIAAVATGDYRHVRSLDPRPLAVVGDCSRAMIRGAPGHGLIGADFSAIESRVLPWVAGEESKLDSYRRYDRNPRPARRAVFRNRLQDLPCALGHLILRTRRNGTLERPVILLSATWAALTPGGSSSLNASATRKSRHSRRNGGRHIQQSKSSGTTLIVRPGLPIRTLFSVPR